MEIGPPFKNIIGNIPDSTPITTVNGFEDHYKLDFDDIYIFFFIDLEVNSAYYKSNYPMATDLSQSRTLIQFNLYIINLTNHNNRSQVPKVCPCRVVSKLITTVDGTLS